MKQTTRLITAASSACLLIAGLSAASTSTPPPSADAGFPIPVPGGTVAGEALSGKTGLPITNAPVMLSRKGIVIMIAVTDGNGVFQFGRLSPGEYTVSLNAGSSQDVDISSHAVFVSLVGN